MTLQTAVVEALLEPISRCLTPESAQRISELRASPAAQSRIDELAEKSSEGTLTEKERAEFEAAVAAANFIAILQSKARLIVQRNRGE